MDAAALGQIPLRQRGQGTGDGGDAAEVETVFAISVLGEGESWLVGVGVGW